MINFKELRIGNWVYSKTYKTKIQMKSFFCLCNLESNTNLFEPIPLTEEWLLKFGFLKYSKNFIKYGEIEFYIWAMNDSYEIKSLDTLIKIETVHELQNLYFLLTKTDLFYE
jgi:hypothetical protein